jgi:hypothetical protein
MRPELAPLNRSRFQNAPFSVSSWYVVTLRTPPGIHADYYVGNGFSSPPITECLQTLGKTRSIKTIRLLGCALSESTSLVDLRREGFDPRHDPPLLRKRRERNFQSKEFLFFETIPTCRCASGA